MAGRPRKTLAQKRKDGDTRKLGRLRFEEDLASTHEAQRGRPPYPAELKPGRKPPGTDEDPQLAARYQATEKRRKRAAEHYAYLCNHLEREGQLSPMDNGILVAAAQAYALMNEAFEIGAVREASDQQKIYMQASNLIGLNESARAKLPKRQAPGMNEFDAAMCADLPTDADTIQ